jgi:TonB family protein
MAGSRSLRFPAASTFASLGLIALLTPAPSQAAPAPAQVRDDGMAVARQTYASAAAGSAERHEAALNLGIQLLHRATNHPRANVRMSTPAPDRAAPSTPSAREELTEAETLFREVVADGGHGADQGEAGLIATMLARGPSGAADANGELQRLQQSGRGTGSLLCIAMRDLQLLSRDRDATLAAGDLLNDHVHAFLPTAPYVVSTRVSRPQGLSTPMPRYTEEARQHQLRGFVVFQAVVDREGKVADVLVLKPGPFSLTDPATKALRGWTYRPALLDGKPVPVCVQPAISFDVQR